MKFRILIQASHPKAQKRQRVCLCLFEWAGLGGSVSLYKNIGDFGLIWPPI